MDKNPLSEIGALFNKLSMPQRILIGGGIGLTIIIIGVLLTFLNEPSYSTLFSNLEESEASRVVEHLSSQSIPYKLEQGGRTVKVPQEVLYETRLQLSSKGIPGSGVVGYEIFDQNTMGMSKFLQQLNYKRALEGELSRTISQIEGVAGVRVHIVSPEKAIFKNDQKPTTASIILKIRNAAAISSRNINSIVNLVSSSVEGLMPDNVTIIDDRGRLLSGDNEQNSLAVSSSRQYEMTQKVENYLSSKAQNLLDNVLGYGNSIIKVSAELNFNQVEKTIQSFDPESQVAISEQLSTSENANITSGDSTGGVTENTTTNYEINKTVERVIEESGNITRLSVAVVINDLITTEMVDGVLKTSSAPRAQEQIQKLENIIKNAVGINENRKDQFSIVNISFETKPLGTEDNTEYSTTTNLLEDWDKLTKFILVLIAIGASLFIVKKLMFRLKNEKIVIGTFNSSDIAYQSAGGMSDQIGGSSNAELEEPDQPKPKKKKKLLPEGDLEDEISDEAAIKKARQAKIASYVQKNPIDAAKMINAWLHEDELN
jgi:flagellar M-ring protein FliF